MTTDSTPSVQHEAVTEAGIGGEIGVARAGAGRPASHSDGPSAGGLPLAELAALDPGELALLATLGC